MEGVVQNQPSINWNHKMSKIALSSKVIAKVDIVARSGVPKNQLATCFTKPQPCCSRADVFVSMAICSGVSEASLSCICLACSGVSLVPVCKQPS